MRRASTIGLFMLAGACVLLFMSTAFGQVTGGEPWPSLHFNYENRRVTLDEGPAIAMQNLTIHWSFECGGGDLGAGRSNPLIDSLGRIFVVGTLVNPMLGPATMLYCAQEAEPDEEGCILAEQLWATPANYYHASTWNTGALHPNGDRVYFAGRGAAGLSLDCWNPAGDPDDPGHALLLYSTPLPLGGQDASDILVDTNDNRLYVFGNSAGYSTGYGIAMDGELAGQVIWWYGLNLPIGYDGIDGDICASPVVCSTQYTYYDYEAGDMPGQGLYWQGMRQPRTIYAPGADGNLYAMHTITGTIWSPPPTLQPPPAPPAGDPPPVHLKWSYTVSSDGDALVSSPVVVPRNWFFQKEPVMGLQPPEGVPPSMKYNHVGVTTSTIYICDPAGSLLCIEDSRYEDHDWEQIGWFPGEPPIPMWIDNNDEVYYTDEGFPMMVGAFPRRYTSHLRWSYDLTGPVATTPILTDMTIFVADETSLHGIDITTGMDPLLDYFGETEGWPLWVTTAGDADADTEWDFSAHPDLGVAPSPVLDGNGLIWLVTRDGYLHVVTTADNDILDWVAGDAVFEYFTPSDDHHRGTEGPPFYSPASPHNPLEMIRSPIISGGYVYVSGQGLGVDPETGGTYETGWVMKIKENVVGRFRFLDVDPKVGYTEKNRMGRIPTVFTYNVNYYDPDCSSVGTYTGTDGDGMPHKENPIILYIDGFHTFWRYDDPFLGYPPFHIHPTVPNRPAPPGGYDASPWGIWEGMVYQIETGDDVRRLGTYEYISDGTLSNPALREYIYYNQNGCFNYFFETEDGFGLNAPIVSEIKTGPNMCPELYFVKTAVIFDGTIARPEKSVVDVSVWYYDSDEDSPGVRDVYLDNIEYSMRGDAVIGNASVPWEDRYSFHVATTNDTPSFHFEFTDIPTAVHPEWPRDAAEPCTTRHPEYGQLFTLLLRNGKVTPAVGPPGIYTYSVRFFDPDGRASGINTGQVGALNAHVYIDDVQYEMELRPENGSQFDGLYTYETSYLDYGEHSFRFDFYYEGQMPRYAQPRGNGVLTSDTANETVEREPPPVIARTSAPEFEYVGPTIAQWPSFNRYQDNNSHESQAFGPSMPMMDTLYLGEPIKGTPVIGGSESTIFAGSRDGKVYAIASDFSQILWEYDAGDFVDCTTALGQERSLVVASRSGTILALDSWTGELRWIFSAANIADSSPCVGVNGDVYIGSFSGTFYSIDGRRGSLNWSYDLPAGGAVMCSAAEGTDSTVYFGSYDNYVYALNSAGLLLWTFETDGMVNSSPSVENNGNVDTVYIGSIDHCLYRLDYDFTFAGPEPVMIWKYDTGAPIQYSSPGIDGQFVYIASDALYAIDKNTGELGWSYVPGGEIFGSIAVDANGVVYFGANDAKMYAVRAPVDPEFVARKEGELVWWQNVGGKMWISGVSISPLNGYGGDGYGVRNGGYGEIYFGCWDGNLYRISDRGYNIPPVLTDPSISPSIGDSAQSFRFGVRYFDADGDEPLVKNVYIDNVAYDMVFTGIGIPSNGEYELYTDFALYKGSHSYYFEFTDGNWVGNTPIYLPNNAPENQYSGPVIDNKPELSDAKIEPAYGGYDQEFVFSVYFSDPDEDPPVSGLVFIDGRGHALSQPAEEGETPFDGSYTYTTTGTELGVGDHAYHFEFEYSVNEWVRIPVVGESTDLTVNNAPVLETGTVMPMTGDTGDDYTYSVHYKDVDNHPPVKANVVVDGISHQMSLYSDFDSDGTYQYTISGDLIGYGQHIYYFDFEDTEGGTAMLPAPPLEPYQGPLVNAIPTLTGGQVSPISGDADVDFTFSVHFADPDGVRPSEVVMVLDGSRFALTLEEGVITDGLYARPINGTNVGLGDDHSFYFEATDDSGSTTRFPLDTSEAMSGPAIVEPGIYVPYWQVNNAVGQDTTLVIGNAGTSHLSSAVDVNVHLYSGLLGIEVDTISHTIVPGEQVKIDFSERFDDELMHFGSAKITWERGSIAVWAMIRNGESQAVSMTLKDPQIRRSYLPYWEVSSESTINTLLAVSNIGGTFVDLDVELYDFDGNSVGATTFMIQPRVPCALQLNQIVEDAEAVGSAVLTWERGILALWGMVVSEDTGKAYEVGFNQPFALSADLPYWIYQRSALRRGVLGRFGSDMLQLAEGPSTNALDFHQPVPAKERSRIDLEPIRNPQVNSQQSKVHNPQSTMSRSGYKAPPVLTGITYSPEAPTTLDQITFTIEYFDEDMDPPGFAAIVIDGDDREMTLEEGEPYDGRYSHRTFLTSGGHEFYFIFSDGQTTVQDPKESNYTIHVTEAAQQLDTWLVVTNLTDTAGPGIVSLFGPTGDVVGIVQTDLAGLYSSAMIKLSETFVLEGYGSGTISMGIASPLLNVWGIIHSDTFDTGFTLNFESRHSQSMYIPYWSINDEYGVDTWISVASRCEDDSVVIINLFDSMGELVGIADREISPNDTWLVNVRDVLFAAPTKMNGRGTVIWDEGEYLLYGAITDLTNKTSYPLAFVQPSVHR